MSGFKTFVRSRGLQLPGQALLACDAPEAGSNLPALSASINTSLAALNPEMGIRRARRASDALAEVIASDEFLDEMDARIGRPKFSETREMYVARAKMALKEMLRQKLKK